MKSIAKDILIKWLDLAEDKLRGNPTVETKDEINLLMVGIRRADQLEKNTSNEDYLLLKEISKKINELAER
jgi:hypothetical protein